MPTSYLETAEAAALLGVDVKAVQKMCRDGQLPGAVKEPGGGWMIPAGVVASWLAVRSGDFPGESSRAETSTTSGDHFDVGNISGSNVAIGRQAQVSVTQGLSGSELENLFKLVYQRIETRPEDPDVDKAEVRGTVQNIESEVSKGEQANPNKVERWLKTLALMAPDILEVVSAALLSPAAAVAAVIRNVVARAQQEAGSAPDA